MNAREQGHRVVRSLTSVLALSGVTVAGGLGVATYAEIQSAKGAETPPTSDHVATAPKTPAGPSGTSPGSPASRGASGTTSTSEQSASSGVSAGSGSSQTSSSGS